MGADTHRLHVRVVQTDGHKLGAEAPSERAKPTGINRPRPQVGASQWIGSLCRCQSQPSFAAGGLGQAGVEGRLGNRDVFLDNGLDLSLS